METLQIILIICVILSASAAAYFFALSQNLREWLDVSRSELTHWQNKALFRQGITPLGKETEPRVPPPDNNAITPRVATRGMRQAMAENRDGGPTINIHAKEVRAPNIQDTVEKAKAILNNEEKS